jgi:probable rRNA maturation factor
MIDVINLQRKVDLEVEAYRDFCSLLHTEVPEAVGKRFAVAFVSDRRMKQLNDMFRGKSGTTDVLSFPNEPDEFDPDIDNLGDIVISAEQAAVQARENDLALEMEIRQLILHGLLHLCGYDHETDDGQMDGREFELREILKCN